MIYFAKRESDGLIKIGTSKNVRRRIYALQKELDESLHLLATCEGSYTAERSIHNSLTDYRIEGEWFSDCKEVRDFIDGLDKFDPPIEGLSPSGGRREIKLILDEPYFSILREEAKRAGHTLREHVRRVVEDYIDPPKRGAKKPSRIAAGDVFDEATGRFVTYNQFHSE